MSHRVIGVVGDADAAAESMAEGAPAELFLSGVAGPAITENTVSPQHQTLANTRL